MKKYLYKDKFVTITNSDVKEWAFNEDTIWWLGITKKTRKELGKIIEKHKLNEDEQYTVAHYEQVLYLADIIHALCNIIQDERKVVADFKEEVQRLIYSLKKLK